MRDHTTLPLDQLVDWIRDLQVFISGQREQPTLDAAKAELAELIEEFQRRLPGEQVPDRPIDLH